ncbi:MAG: hypothetical protein ACJ8FY_02800 [Gemmataceae bacterium]
MARPSYRHVVLFLLAVVIVFQLTILFKRASSVPAATSRARLSDLVWRLHDKGLDFRVVSQRPDGLWDEDVYLTTTDKTFREITKYPVNPDFVDKWKGKVAVMHRDADGMGDDCFFYEDFVLFGDPEMITKIRLYLTED